MIMHKIIMASLLCLLLAGCSDESDKPDSAESTDNSFLSPQLQAIDKAENVEQMLKDSFNKQNQIMDTQGQ